jgi:hypothetical protein
MDWIDLAQDAVVHFCKKGNVLSGSNKLREIVEYLSSWRLLENVSSCSSLVDYKVFV